MVGDSAIRRQRMVRQLRARGISDPRVLEVMARIPRERFIDEAMRGKAYSDASLPIGRGQTISQPWVVARMCELVEADGTGKVLEIGGGSGYHSAVLAHLFELVYSIERIPLLARRSRRTLRELGVQNVHIKIFDGGYGWSEFAPYRAIVVTAAVPEIPAHWVEQLEEGGRLVLPLGGPQGREEQTLTRVTKTAKGSREESFGPCRFVPLLGRFGWRAS